MNAADGRPVQHRASETRGRSRNQGVDAVPLYGYGDYVKRRDLETALRGLGWTLAKHGGRHDLWSHPDKTKKIVIPRHTEIKVHLARSILRQAAE